MFALFLCLSSSASASNDQMKFGMSCDKDEDEVEVTRQSDSCDPAVVVILLITLSGELKRVPGLANVHSTMEMESLIPLLAGHIVTRVQRVSSPATSQAAHTGNAMSSSTLLKVKVTKCASKTILKWLERGSVVRMATLLSSLLIKRLPRAVITRH